MPPTDERVTAARSRRAVIWAPCTALFIFKRIPSFAGSSAPAEAAQSAAGEAAADDVTHQIALWAAHQCGPHAGPARPPGHHWRPARRLLPRCAAFKLLNETGAGNMFHDFESPRGCSMQFHSVRLRMDAPCASHCSQNPAPYVLAIP